ncbi:hypothetical protein [Rhodococcus xishaensis]|uniref:Condensation domain-containing protein n=1 Tax=Rhodococcus xishaensis TaxID=2487364 RepID=A0A3S3AET8_9NOCA|nr:hypothetical protein [Rhodococcus xishaensis]RVW02970.1 hypothetical protein EGT50_09660 [Rhodococcus xishaensis]
MDRLTTVDEIFLRRHHGYGVPIVMQGIWRTADAVDAAVLGSVHEELTLGALGRRVVRPRVPGARLRWEASTTAHPLRYETDPVDDVVRWADNQSDVDVDPEVGPAWALSAAPVTGGGTVISLVCSHVVADARGLVSAVETALSGRPPAPTPPRTSDVADAVRTVGTVLIGGARASSRLAFSAKRRRELREHADANPRPQPGRTHVVTGTCTAILDVDAAEWKAAATAEDGTANGLFIAVVTGIAGAAGVPMPLRISVPVDTRNIDTVDRSAVDHGAADNAVVMTEVVATPDDSLADIRRLNRDAFARPPMGAPPGFPAETLQILTDRVAHRLTSGAGERDALCSNIGHLPDTLTSLGPYPTTGVATRAMHPRLSAERTATTTTRLSAYLCSYGDKYTLSLVGMDQQFFDAPERLRDLAIAQLGKWGLSARPW